MAIVYPLTPPAEFNSADIQITCTSVVSVTASPYNLTEQIQVNQGQRIELMITVAKKKRLTAERVVAFLLALNGPEGTFYCGDTANKVPLGVATGAPKVNGIATARSKYLVTDGWTPSTANILRRGDWVQIGTGSTRRLHKIIYADVNSDAGGNATLTLWPNVRTAYADNLDIVVASPTGVFRLKESTSYGIDLNRIYSIGVPVWESIF